MRYFRPCECKTTLSKVLIIDDEEKLRKLLARVVELEGFAVSQAADCGAAWKKLEQEEIAVVFCDVKLPDGNGVAFSKKIKEHFPTTQIILLTAYGNIPDGVQAIKNGAFDYITKGDDDSKIIPLLHTAMERAVQAKNTAQSGHSSYSFDAIIGAAPPIQHAIELAKKVAPTDTTVLLTGETGTGKEVFAQAIHKGSARAAQAFVALNCATFGRELLESEMFGHKAGAFTGATKDKKGLFEEAHKGTIFLDEIGEMALDLQAKLLRVLETGEFFRVGESKPLRVNVRVIAATNRDLKKEIQEGTFREDLFYRISVFQIHLPALRERTADIEALARHFLKIFAAKANKKLKPLSKEFLDALMQHQWSGNIRELKNVMERSVILCDDELKVEHLPIEIQHAITRGESHKILSAFDLASAEKIHIQKVLNYTNGNKTKAAELLNIALTTLYRKIHEYGIE